MLLNTRLVWLPTIATLYRLNRPVRNHPDSHTIPIHTPPRFTHSEHLPSHTLLTNPQDLRGLGKFSPVKLAKKNLLVAQWQTSAGLLGG